jgi:predicted Ser/Thr protein kinase
MPQDVAVGSILSNRYEILGLLGQGGAGSVYRAHDRTLDETVVVKTIRAELGPDVGQLLQTEIRLSRRVNHRNVCRVFEYGEDGPHRYIVMEFIDGIDLHLLARERSLTMVEACGLILQVCEGLHAIHEQGIVHRDLKPTNLMRDKRGVVRLLDFGVARETGDAAFDEVWGTPEYMSPEQSLGRPADVRSDIYSLGLVFLELLGTEAVPDALVPVLSQAMAQKPEDRYPSVRAMAIGILEAVDRLPIDAADLDEGLVLEPLDEPAPIDAASASEGRLAVLMTCLRSDQADVRWRSALALVALGEAALPAVAALIEALADEDEFVRDAAARALAAVGRPAVPALLAAMSEDQGGTRFRAASILTRIGGVPEPPPGHRPASAVPCLPGEP